MVAKGEDGGPPKADLFAQRARGVAKERLKRDRLAQARQRLMNIRLVKPDLAMAVENYLISAASSGRLSRPLTDEELKQLLMRIQQPKKEFKFDRR